MPTGTARPPRRTTTRPPTARRAPARRSKGRTLTPRQQREVGGVVLAGVGLLAGLAVSGATGRDLAGLGDAILALFGAGWLLVVAAMLVGAGLLLWPRTPRPSRWTLVRVGAGLAAVLALSGLLAMVSVPAGGLLGVGIADLARHAGPVGAVLILVPVLVAGLVVAIPRFSVAGTAGAAVGAVRVAFGQRHRLLPVLATARGLRARLERARATVTDRRDGEPAEQPGESEAPTAPPAEEPPDEDAEEPVLEGELIEAGATPPVERITGDWDREEKVEWRLPTAAILDAATARKERAQDEIKRNIRIIEGTLATFGVQARVLGANTGPAVTQYELQPAAGVPVRKVVSLHNDLSMALAASPLRIEAPIPGKSAIGIEVPNKAATLVTIRDGAEAAGLLGGKLPLGKRYALGVVLGQDVGGEHVAADLTRMPHLLIAGATGQGKSVCINTIICSLLLQLPPTQLRMVMIDPKRVELQQYQGLPHLAVPVIVDPKQAASALRWAVAEMERRYKLLGNEGVRNIAVYNERAAIHDLKALPYVVIVIDELADLMMVAAGEIEELVCRIAQLARAVGIHLVIATQRPSTDIITGLIKANVPSRIAFAVGSQVDSRVILDRVGAEKLLGRGDMLYQPVDAGSPTRLQGAFISDREVESLVQFWTAQGAPRYVELEDLPPPEETASRPERRLDSLFARAARAVAAEGAASVSLVQRKFNVGYSRAGRIVDQLAEHRVIGSYQGSKSREVLMSLPDVDDLLAQIGLEG